MIEWTSGVRFQVVAAAGSRGWLGHDEGHGFVRVLKAPFRWLGQFPKVPVVTKTVTRYPRRGWYEPWRPWRSVRPVGCSALVNAMSLPNMGVEAWVGKYGHALDHLSFPVFLSIAAENTGEVAQMTRYLRRQHLPLGAIELNTSCPSTGRLPDVDEVLSLTGTLRHETNGLYPLIVKLSIAQDYLAICKELDGKVEAIHLINTVPWERVYPGTASPLLRYLPAGGGVSGQPIASLSRGALQRARPVIERTRLISGGGVLDVEEGKTRLQLGADAVSLGSIYLLRPWRVRRVIHELSWWRHPEPGVSA